MSPGALYYRLALSLARDGDLTGAAKYAAISLSLDKENTGSQRLLEICAYELGLTGHDDLSHLKLSPKNTANPLARFKALRALKSSRQSVRVLNILGCLYAIWGGRKKSAYYFALALAKDKGNALAAAALRELKA